MKAVHVFGGGDGFNDLLRVHVGGQGQLHQDAVDGGVVVQRLHSGQQIGFGQGGVGGEGGLVFRLQAALVAGDFGIELLDGLLAVEHVLQRRRVAIRDLVRGLRVGAGGIGGAGGERGEQGKGKQRFHDD